MDFTTASRDELLASRATMNCAAVWAQRTKPLFSADLMGLLRARGTAAFADVPKDEEEASPPTPEPEEPEETCGLEEEMRNLRSNLAEARADIRNSTEELATLKLEMRKQRKENRMMTRKSSFTKVSAGRFASRPAAVSRVTSRLSGSSSGNSSSGSIGSDADLDYEVDNDLGGRGGGGDDTPRMASTRGSTTDDYIFIDDEIVTSKGTGGGGGGGGSGTTLRAPKSPRGPRRRAARTSTRTVSNLSSYGSSRHQLSLGAHSMASLTSPVPKKPRRRGTKKKKGTPKRKGKKGGKKGKSSTRISSSTTQEEASFGASSPLPSSESPTLADLADDAAAGDPMAAWAIAKAKATKAAAAAAAAAQQPASLLHPMSPEVQRRKMMMQEGEVAVRAALPAPTTPVANRRSALSLLRRLREDTMKRREERGSNSFRLMATSG